jgi:acyl-CoA reductase-like NAD-dependent aldehyde dehydrogenase
MIINPPADSTVMKDEIVGPVLPIIGYDSDNAAVNFVNSRATPLALYLMSNGKADSSAGCPGFPPAARLSMI